MPKKNRLFIGIVTKKSTKKYDHYSINCGDLVTSVTIYLPDLHPRLLFIGLDVITSVSDQKKYNRFQLAYKIANGIYKMIQKSLEGTKKRKITHIPAIGTSSLDIKKINSFHQHISDRLYRKLNQELNLVEPECRNILIDEDSDAAVNDFLSSLLQTNEDINTQFTFDGDPLDFHACMGALLGSDKELFSQTIKGSIKIYFRDGICINYPNHDDHIQYVQNVIYARSESRKKSSKCIVSGCDKNVIGSHTVSQSRFLDLIADKKGRVSELNSLHYRATESIGLRDCPAASSNIFYYFCDDHDSSFFKTVDNWKNGYALKNRPRDILACRSIIKSCYDMQEFADQWLDGHELRGEPYFEKEGAKSLLKSLKQNVKLNDEDLKLCLKILQDKTQSEVFNHYSFCLVSETDLIVSEHFLVQSTRIFDRSGLILNIFPHKSKSGHLQVILSWKKEFESLIQKFIEPILTCAGDITKQQILISNLILFNCRNIVFRREHIRGWDNSVINDITKFLNLRASEMGKIDLNYLVENNNFGLWIPKTHRHYDPSSCFKWDLFNLFVKNYRGKDRISDVTFLYESQIEHASPSFQKPHGI